MPPAGLAARFRNLGPLAERARGLDFTLTWPFKALLPPSRNERVLTANASFMRASRCPRGQRASNPAASPDRHYRSTGPRDIPYPPFLAIRGRKCSMTRTPRGPRPGLRPRARERRLGTIRCAGPLGFPSQPASLANVVFRVRESGPG